MSVLGMLLALAAVTNALTTFTYPTAATIWDARTTLIITWTTSNVAPIAPTNFDVVLTNPTYTTNNMTLMFAVPAIGDQAGISYAQYQALPSVGGYVLYLVDHQDPTSVVAYSPAFTVEGQGLPPLSASSSAAATTTTSSKTAGTSTLAPLTISSSTSTSTKVHASSSSSASFFAAVSSASSTGLAITPAVAAGGHADQGLTSGSGRLTAGVSAMILTVGGGLLVAFA